LVGPGGAGLSRRAYRSRLGKLVDECAHRSEAGVVGEEDCGWRAPHQDIAYRRCLTEVKDQTRGGGRPSTFMGAR